MTEDSDAIFKKFNKNYRYEIRRCEKENIKYKVFWGKELLENLELFEKFIEVYNQMRK